MTPEELATPELRSHLKEHLETRHHHSGDCADCVAATALAHIDAITEERDQWRKSAEEAFEELGRVRP